MSNLEAGLRLEVRRLTASDTRWAFQILDLDDRNLSGEPKETYATRREATQAGQAVVQRLRSKPSEQLAAQPGPIDRQAGER